MSGPPGWARCSHGAVLFVLLIGGITALSYALTGVWEDGGARAAAAYLVGAVVCFSLFFGNVALDNWITEELKHHEEHPQEVPR